MPDLKWLASFIAGFLLAACLFTPLERLFPLHRRPLLRRDLKLDLTHFFLNEAVRKSTIILTTGLMYYFLSRNTGHPFRVFIKDLPLWAQLFLAFAVADFANYWFHRWMHTVPWLWRIHAIHHSIEEMDWLASARLNPLDQIIRRTLSFGVLFLFGFPPGVFKVYTPLLIFWAIFIHANVRFRFGWLEFVLATPAFHHFHHAHEPEFKNRNFSGLFPVWDILFGTFSLPRHRWPIQYGVNEPVGATWLAHLAYPFRNPP